MREGGGQGEIEREPNSSQNKPNITAIADRSYLILADKIQSHIHLFPRIKEECTFLFKVNINSSIYYPWDCTIFCDFTKKKKSIETYSNVFHTSCHSSCQLQWSVELVHNPFGSHLFPCSQNPVLHIKLLRKSRRNILCVSASVCLCERKKGETGRVCIYALMTY